MVLLAQQRSRTSNAATTAAGARHQASRRAHACCEDGRDGQQRLVEQAGRGKLREEVRAALGVHAVQPALVEGAHRAVQVDVVVAGDDHVGALGDRVEAGRIGCAAGDHDGADLRPGEERRAEVELERAADDGDRGDGRLVGGRAAVGELGLDLRGLVALRADRAGTREDDVGEAAEPSEDAPVGVARCGRAVEAGRASRRW
ncbi:MAG: hypothetical protein U0R76_00775 [Candidatus Nanopelagicales bacterium]